MTMEKQTIAGQLEGAATQQNTDNPLVANRRKRLAEFFKSGRPSKEKSLFSQLTTGSAPFGEKLARRLERDYGMELGYLDRDEQGCIPGAEPGSSYKVHPERADVAVTIIKGALELVGLPKSFFGPEEVVKEAIVKGTSIDFCTLGDVKMAMIELWEEEAEKIAILGEALGDGQESVEQARRRLGEDIAGMLVAKLHEQAERRSKQKSRQATSKTVFVK